MKKLTREEIIAIARFAFKAGENWGVTYSGWYEPSQKDRESKINGVIEQIIEFNELNEPNENTTKN